MAGIELEYLSNEKFKALEELSQVQTQLSLAKSELISIRDNLEEFYRIREKELNKKIQEYLQSSQEVLTEIGNNYKAIHDFKGEVQRTSDDVQASKKVLSETITSVQTVLTFADSFLAQKMSSNFKMVKDLKAERIVIEEERKKLEAERLRLKEEDRVLRDKRAAFERAWTELQNKE